MSKKRISIGKGSVVKLFNLVSRLIIAGLCLYIINYSIENIFEINIVKKVGDSGKMAFYKLCRISSKDKTTFMHYLEADKFSWAEYLEGEIVNGEFKNLVEETSKDITTKEKKTKPSKDEEVKVKETAISAEELIKKVEVENEETTPENKGESMVVVEQEVKAEVGIVPKPKITGIKYTAKKLGGFEKTIDKFYTVASATSIKESDLDITRALDMKFEIEGDGSKPQILIYHTHSQETFSENKSSKSIVQVGSYLAKILREQFGYNVIHDTSTYDLVNGKLDRNVAYDQARTGVSKILSDNPSINLVLDIHRDGVGKNTHLLCEVNEKDTAQIMFFNGMSRFKDEGEIDYLYNPYLRENLALSFQMKLNAEAYYPGFTRNNYLNAYKYNLDLCEKCMLIELGAQTNSFEEAKNAAEPLAMLIHMTMGK